MLFVISFSNDYWVQDSIVLIFFVDPSLFQRNQQSFHLTQNSITVLQCLKLSDFSFDNSFRYIYWYLFSPKINVSSSTFAFIILYFQWLRNFSMNVLIVRNNTCTTRVDHLPILDVYNKYFRLAPYLLSLYSTEIV